MTQMFYPESQMERKKVDMSTLPKKNTFAFNLELVGAAWTVGTMHPWNLGTLAQKVGIKTQQAYAIRWQLKEAAQYLTQSRLNWENDKVWLSTVRLTEAAQPNDDTVASETDFQQVDYQKVGQYLAQGEYDILDDYLAGFGLSDFEKHEIMCEAVSYIHEYEDDQNGWA